MSNIYKVKEVKITYHPKVKASERLRIYSSTDVYKLLIDTGLVFINSTPEYNKKCGGAPKSQHIEGTAADIKVSGISPLDVAKAAESVGFTGIGVYTHSGNSFTHVDVRALKTYWTDLPGHQLKSVKSLNEVKTTMLTSNDTISIYQNNKKVQFVIDDMILQSRLLDGGYPETDRRPPRAS